MTKGTVCIVRNALTVADIQQFHCIALSAITSSSTTSCQLARMQILCHAAGHYNAQQHAASDKQNWTRPESRRPWQPCVQSKPSIGRQQGCMPDSTPHLCCLLECAVLSSRLDNALCFAGCSDCSDRLSTVSELPLRCHGSLILIQQHLAWTGRCA